jgi:hypothetical protein
MNTYLSIIAFTATTKPHSVGIAFNTDFTTVNWRVSNMEISFSDTSHILTPL